MDTKIINVYNERNQKLVSSGLLIVDAALEPLRVLKVLVEGLPDGRSGLWLTNFKGIPVARTLSPFDLIYLDRDYSVVHCVEISTEGEYEPFRGDPASALVVPPKSIVASRLRAGDRLLFRTVDAEASQQSSSSSGPAGKVRHATLRPPQQPADQPGGTHFFNSSFPLPSNDGMGDPLPGFLGRTQTGSGGAPAASASADQNPGVLASAPSGRLTKSAKSILGTSSAFRPTSNDGSSSSQPQIAMGSIATAPNSAPPVEMAFSVKAPTRLMGSAAEAPPDSRSIQGMPSGRLLRTVNLAPAILPEEEPEAAPVEPTPKEPAAQQGLTPYQAAFMGNAAAAPPEVQPHEPHHGIVIPIDGAPALHHIPVHEEQASPFVPAPAALPTPEPYAAPSSISEAAREEVESDFAADTPVTEAPASAPAERPAPLPVTFYEPGSKPAAMPAAQAPARLGPIAVPAPAATTAPRIEPQAPASELNANSAMVPFRPEPAPYPRTQIKLAEQQQQSLAVSQKKKKPSWDVRLLYSFFPEFDPARPLAIRMPRVGEKPVEPEEDEEQLSTKLRLLCWLYPDLHLDKFKQKRSEERRAVRLPAPGLVAYFFTGGSPRPHPIKDISVTGFYMCTEERWLPGTIIRITLQMIDPRPDGRRDSVTVHSRVVRWGPDGGGFEFVLPGFLEQ